MATIINTPVHVNGNTAEARKLNPFTYTDIIKSLDKSNEARVTIDGNRVFRSCATSGRDVKAHTGMKYHLYFYATEADSKLEKNAGRQWIRITQAEFSEYKNNPASIFDIESAPVAAEESAPVAAPVAAKGKKAKREAVAA